MKTLKMMVSVLVILGSISLIGCQGQSDSGRNKSEKSSTTETGK